MSAPGTWEQRRRFMWANTVFNMIVVLYCVWTKQDSGVAKIAVEACFWSNSATLLFYVFGATVQDILALRSGYLGNVKQSTTETKEVLTTRVPAPKGKSR